MVDRNLEKQPRKHHGLAEAAADQERADTDVFAAVRTDDTTQATPAVPEGERRD